MNRWGVEEVRSFVPNVVSFIITLGRKCWYGVRAYVPPNEIPTANWTTKAFDLGTKGMGKLLVGNLNAYLANPRYQQEEQLETVLAGNVLTDQAKHFVPIQKYRV